jgi:hypothetical protein
MQQLNIQNPLSDALCIVWQHMRLYDRLKWLALQKTKKTNSTYTCLARTNFEKFRPTLLETHGKLIQHKIFFPSTDATSTRPTLSSASSCCSASCTTPQGSSTPPSTFEKTTRSQELTTQEFQSWINSSSR